MTSFVDTNILLYSISVVPRERAKRQISLGIIEEIPCAFSVQIFNEFIWRSTHLNNPSVLSRAAARRFVDAWRRFPVQPVDNAVFDAAWDISARTNYSWWDCLVIGAARTIGSEKLLSEDMQHGHVIDGVRIENPFRDLG